MGHCRALERRMSHDGRSGCHHRRGPCRLSACDVAAPARFSERVALLNDKAMCRTSGRRYPRPIEGDRRTGQPDVSPEKFFPNQNIELISDRAVSIDRAARKVLFASGASLDYGSWCWRPARAIACSNSQRQPRQRALFADARRKPVVARPHRCGPERHRDRRRIHRAGIRRDCPGQGLESGWSSSRQGDGARRDHGNLGIRSIAAHRGPASGFISACRSPASRATAARSPASASATGGISRPI